MGFVIERDKVGESAADIDGDGVVHAELPFKSSTVQPFKGRFQAPSTF
jgi:hypothetical protein